MYKLGIKRRFFPGYKWFMAVSHMTEIVGDSARLVITTGDGLKRAIPRIQTREVLIYPEYTAPTQTFGGPPIE